MLNRFELDNFNTSVKQEVLAGIVAFFSISYILFVNPSILSQAGVPEEYSVFSTIFIAVIGTFLMGTIANAPVVMAPGMGENAFFTFTLVAGLGLTWQQGLASVIITGILFVIVAFLGIMKLFSESIPKELKQAITIGIGLFLILIGLENTGLLIDGTFNLNGIGLAGLFLVIILKRINVKGGFLIAILLTTVLYWLVNFESIEAVSFNLKPITEYSKMLTAADYSNMFSFEFWLGVFSLLMLLIFETIGMLEALIPDQKRINKGYKVGAVSGLLSGLLGTSPAIPVAESGAGIAEGGKTGLTAVTASMLFLFSIILTPFLSYIPSEAVGPVIIVTGATMALANLKIRLEHLLDWIPLILIILMIPLTGSIVEGMAYGFIAFPIVKSVTGRRKETNSVLWVISILFLFTLVSTFLIA
ncbi:putative MFS transporter, AGZA family, xanthine/uracil permease [Marinilactibacillus piezotolerans]|uniref:Putative MFS transporter, AGZA family, xanthine/uracil permease n=1 Tax=Marinilactibacillus piezotolerans TaxID=258723 RepID=A0A1I3W5V1_9LACT|nr:NCS2 family permease [Marinilactibacillus piezotolerans]SFK02047.1 putative MFS transporter, AGZA family, xanthine/uracil permease [Marinilactibacillus piezotolerans]